MFWFMIAVILIVISLIISFMSFVRAHSGKKRTYVKKCFSHRDESPKSKRVLDCLSEARPYEHCEVRELPYTFQMSVFAGVSLIFLGVFALIAIPVTAVQISNANNVENSFYFLEEAAAQREALLKEFDEVLDNDDFVQLMNASVPEDVRFLKNNPQVTGFLLGRADRIVEVNATLFKKRNEILEESKAVCNITNNALIPQLPFFTPECKLGDVFTITSPIIEE